MSKNILADARAEALFASTVSAHEPVSRVQADGAIRVMMAKLHAKGCAAQVAQEFGDHPDTAVARMRWAVATVAKLYDRPRCGCTNAAKTLIADRLVEIIPPTLVLDDDDDPQYRLDFFGPEDGYTHADAERDRALLRAAAKRDEQAGVAVPAFAAATWMGYE